MASFWRQTAFSDMSLQKLDLMRYLPGREAAWIRMAQVEALPMDGHSAVAKVEAGDD